MKTYATPTAGPAICRRCTASLAGTAALASGGRLCDVCGYVTIDMPSATIRFPLEHFAQWAPGTPALIRNEDDPERVQVALGKLCEDTTTWVRRQVEVCPGAALQWFLSLLTNSGELSEKEKATASRDLSRPYRILQIMYSILIRRGPLDFSGERPLEIPAFFLNDAYAVLGDISVLTNLVTLSRRGSYQLRITDRELLAYRSMEDLELLEFGQNIAREKTARIDVLEPDFVDVQKSVLGASFDDLFAFIDPSRRNTGIVGNQTGDLISIDLDRCAPSVIKTVDVFTLTLERWRRFAAPFFFDLGPLAVPPRSDDTVLIESGQMLWVAYYPFFSALTVRRPQGRVALTTVPLMRQFFAVADSSKAHLLHRLRDRSRELGKEAFDAATRFACLRHKRFEKSVGEQFQAAGMTVQVGLAAMRGRGLPCGEIDVLAATAHHSDGRPIVLVCEAKNVDLPLQKDLGYDHLAETMDRARTQVEGKATWVASSWPAIASLFGLSGETVPIVVGMIITRRTIPLRMLGRWAGAALQEVKAVADHLIGTPVAAWRSDLGKGIIRPGA